MAADDEPMIVAERLAELALELERLVEAAGIAIDETDVRVRSQERYAQVTETAALADDVIDETHVTAVDAIASIRRLVSLVGNTSKLASGGSRLCYRATPPSPQTYFDESDDVQYWMCGHDDPHYDFVV